MRELSDGAFLLALGFAMTGAALLVASSGLFDVLRRGSRNWELDAQPGTSRRPAGRPPGVAFVLLAIAAVLLLVSLVGAWLG